MCDFQSGTIECRGDGYLWDADNDGYDPDDMSEACPKCNTEQYLINAKEDAETTSAYSNLYESGTGVTIWESAVSVATQCNEQAAKAALTSIGTVAALYHDVSAEDGTRIKRFMYGEAA